MAAVLEGKVEERIDQYESSKMCDKILIRPVLIRNSLNGCCPDTETTKAYEQMKCHR